VDDAQLAVVRVALEGVRQVDAVFQGHDHVGSSEAKEGAGAPGDVAVHLVAFNESVGDARPDFGRLTPMPA
jgi:hypothetical protein